MRHASRAAAPTIGSTVQSRVSCRRAIPQRRRTRVAQSLRIGKPARCRPARLVCFPVSATGRCGGMHEAQCRRARPQHGASHRCAHAARVREQRRRLRGHRLGLPGQHVARSAHPEVGRRVRGGGGRRRGARAAEAQPQPPARQSSITTSRAPSATPACRTAVPTSTPSSPASLAASGSSGASTSCGRACRRHLSPVVFRPSSAVSSAACCRRRPCCSSWPPSRRPAPLLPPPARPSRRPTHRPSPPRPPTRRWPLSCKARPTRRVSPLGAALKARRQAPPSPSPGRPRRRDPPLGLAAARDR